MSFVLVALLLCACTWETHAPSVLAPCPRVPIAVITAGEGECVRLQDEGRALFKLDTSESCGGPACLRLEPGQTGLVLEKIKPGPAAEWGVTRGACDEVPSC